MSARIPADVGQEPDAGSGMHARSLMTLMGSLSPVLKVYRRRSATACGLGDKTSAGSGAGDKTSAGRLNAMVFGGRERARVVWLQVDCGIRVDVYVLTAAPLVFGRR